MLFGSAALSAHAVVLQLWMITSYVVDGFADVGTMHGARLLGAGSRRQPRSLTWKLAALGLATGPLAASSPCCGICLRAFTRDPKTDELLGRVWPLLCGLQPVNAIVFVYDGLLRDAIVFLHPVRQLALCEMGVARLHRPPVCGATGMRSPLACSSSARRGSPSPRRCRTRFSPSGAPRPAPQRVMAA